MMEHLKYYFYSKCKNENYLCLQYIYCFSVKGSYVNSTRKNAGEIGYFEKGTVIA